jgi:hypothetical protein
MLSGGHSVNSLELIGRPSPCLRTRPSSWTMQHLENSGLGFSEQTAMALFKS